MLIILNFYKNQTMNQRVLQNQANKAYECHDTKSEGRIGADLSI